LSERSSKHARAGTIVSQLRKLRFPLAIRTFARDATEAEVSATQCKIK
jgi:hypothetical protein